LPLFLNYNHLVGGFFVGFMCLALRLAISWRRVPYYLQKIVLKEKY